MLIVVAAAVVLAGVGIGLGIGLSGGGGAGKGGSTSTTGKLLPLSTLGPLRSVGPLGGPGPEGPPIESGNDLAPMRSYSAGATVDGIQCQTSEQAAFHIHSRLTIYENGRQVRVPYGIGIPHAQTQSTPEGPFVGGGTCLFWLHTHAADGIIHIESPITRTFTLGNFFDIWGQPLSSSQVGPDKGHVTVLYNGKVWTGNPRDVPLGAHSQIQLEVGRPLVAPVLINNWYSL